MIVKYKRKKGKCTNKIVAIHVIFEECAQTYLACKNKYY
jgi:hypothetical protein